MRKKINILLIVAPILFLLLLTITLAFMRAYLPEVSVRIAGYDPLDPLSGHYIAYTIDWQNTDCAQFENQSCPKEAFGESYPDSMSNNTFRFYIPEQKAEELNRVFLDAEKNNQRIEMVYGYKPGFRPLAKKILINGKEIFD